MTDLWILDAACRRVDPELMFPCPTDTEGVEIARRICGRCTVTTHCATAAIGQTDGVWAGVLHQPPAEEPAPRESTWTRERANESNRRSLATSPIVEHGTPNGYSKHRARGEEACPACREAHRVKSQRYRDRRRKQASRSAA